MVRAAPGGEDNEMAKQLAPVRAAITSSRIPTKNTSLKTPSLALGPPEAARTLRVTCRVLRFTRSSSPDGSQTYSSFSILRTCLPYSNSDFNHISTIFMASCSLTIRAPIEIIFALLCSLARRALCSFQHRAQRIP